QRSRGSPSHPWSRWERLDSYHILIYSGKPMSNRTPVLSSSANPKALFPTLTAAQIERMRAHGKARQVRRGDVLIQRGQHAERMFVVVAGEVEIVRPMGTSEDLVAV